MCGRLPPAADGPHQLLDAAQVGGEAGVDRGVEGHLAGAVDHGVQIRRQVRHAGQVALDHAHVLVDEPGQIRAEPLPQRGERRLVEQADDSVTGGQAAERPHEHEDLRFGNVGEQPLEQGLTDEAGDPGQQHASTREPRAHTHSAVVQPTSSDRRPAYPSQQ